MAVVVLWAAFAAESQALGSYFVVAARGMNWLAPSALREKLWQGAAAMRLPRVLKNHGNKTALLIL